MMRMGMVSTAHEQFKALRMWPEAVECLMVAERNVEAEDMIKEQLREQESPRLWCCLGDVEKDPRHWEKAWELSGKRFARAQRSLGRHYMMKGETEKAILRDRGEGRLQKCFCLRAMRGILGAARSPERGSVGVFSSGLRARIWANVGGDKASDDFLVCVATGYSLRKGQSRDQ